MTIIVSPCYYDNMDDGLTVTHRKLPHWRLAGATYLITFCLAEHQPPLAPEERTLVESNLKHFHNERYHLLAHVVMDDHVHAIAYPFPGVELSSITHGWKSFSANRLQRLFNRKGQIWMRESHDRIIRSERDCYEKAEYVMTNPQRRWPGIKDYRWVGWMQK